MGEPADVLSAGISLIRGDLTGAALSAGAAIPGAGWLFSGVKFGRRYGKYADEAADAALEGGDVGIRAGDEIAGLGDEVVEAGGDVAVAGKGHAHTPSSKVVPAKTESSRFAPELEAPTTSDPTRYQIGDLDKFNRPTSVEAVMTAKDLPRLRRPRNPRNLPAGTEKGIGYELTHLGAHELGFPTTGRNLATASGQSNRFLGPRRRRPPSMREVEVKVKRALKAGQTVRYRVTAIS